MQNMNLDTVTVPTVFQHLLMPHDSLIRDLYYRVPDGECDFKDDAIVLERGCRLSTNSYFNSFYESYWSSFARLGNVYLSGEFEGDVVVEVFRDTEHQGCHRIARYKIQTTAPERHTIRVPPIGPLSQPGRVFFDILARRASRVSLSGFCTDAAPIRTPRLTIGVCTFNREEFVAQNIAALSNRFESDPRLLATIVVNQGKPFEHPEILRVVEASSKTKIVTQRNLGGCGGFTRSIMESASYPDANYHLLMDDDVQLDPMVVANLMNLIAYLDDEVIVGGHMLDMLRPWMLYEAGATVHSNGRITPLHHNVDLRDVQAPSRFNSSSTVHYNAWWFCAIPTRWIPEAKLPAPIFIRGDDMEFGIRFSELGVKTIAMPGIGVWHEPFYLKVGSWQTYYDYRNRLIMASAYPERFKLEDPKLLNWTMMRALAVHDYQQAALLSEAMLDFIKGPTLLETDASKIHERVALLAKQYAPKTVSSVDSLPSIKHGKLPMKRVARLSLVTRRIIGNALGAGRRKTYLCLDNEIHPAHIRSHPYVKTNGLRSYFLLYSPDRAHLMPLLRKCRSAYREYDQHRARVSEEWHRQLPQFRQSESWANIFGSVG